MTAPHGQQEERPGIEADNIIDLLLNEALQDAESMEDRARVLKVAHGVYEVGNNEVTFHVLSGRLFVYRVGDVVRHCPVKALLQEEGILPGPTPIALDPTNTGSADALSGGHAPASGSTAPATTPAISGAADTSAVEDCGCSGADLRGGHDNNHDASAATLEPLREPERRTWAA